MPATGRQTKIKILSFNILAEQFIDYNDLSADYYGISSTVLREKNRLPKMMAFLKAVNADILLLQEVNFKVLKKIKNTLSNSYTIYPLALHKTTEALMPGNSYGNLIIVKKDIGTTGKQVVHRVPKIGTAFAFLEIKINGSKVLIVNVHLNSDPEETIRRKEIAILLKLIKPYLGDTIIMTGDFNTSDKKTHGNFSAFQSAISEHKGTYLNDEPMIDWIYVRNADLIKGSVLKPKRAGPETPLKKYGSDHYPVIAVIKM